MGCFEGLCWVRALIGVVFFVFFLVLVLVPLLVPLRVTLLPRYGIGQ